MCENTVSQMVLYENDAVVASYADGAGLELAPCASTFIYHQARNTGQHPLHGHEVIQQRCEFVTSSFKPKVRQAIEFRNQYAVRPYLCRELLEPKDVQKLCADLCEIAWPQSLRHASYVINSDLSVTLRSVCGSATLHLSASRQHFSVQFLCHTSRNRGKDTVPSLYKPKPAEKSDEFVGSERVDRLLNYCVQSKTGNKLESDVVASEPWEYATVNHHHSVQVCPDVWRHAVDIALEAAQAQRTVKFEQSVEFPQTFQHTKTEEYMPVDTIEQGSDDETGLCELSSKTKGSDVCVKSGMKCVYSTVPKALWLNCISPHLHKWCGADLWDNEEKFAESAVVNGRIKVLSLRGVNYRFLWSHPRTIEIYPGDGTVLRSSGLSGHFFNHYYNHCGKIEEKMYSVDRPPPDTPGAAYSVARLILTAARFLRHLYEDGGAAEVNCCWKEDTGARLVRPALPTVLLEECLVPGVGRFTAYSSGRVRVMYSDRTALDTWADFSKRLGLCKQHSEDDAMAMPDLHSYQPKSSKTRHLISELPPGVAKLMLPNGHYQHVILSQPGQYLKYVKAAEEWVSWVNSSPTERHKFYKDTLHDPVKVTEVNRELRKINCFNYIIENTLLSDFQDPQVGQMEATVSPNDDCDPGDVTPSAYFPSIRATELTANTTEQWSAASFACGRNVISSRDVPDVDFDFVQEALRKTSQAVSDLDSYLRNNSENVTQTARRVDNAYQN